MARIITTSGFRKLEDRFKKAAKKKRDEALLIRKKFILRLVQELIQNIPVWSGRTVESIRVSTDGRKARKAPAPARKDWHQFGATSQMALGDEPRRSAAESVALGQVERFGAYKTLNPIHVTVHSIAWPLVESASAPVAPGRNTAVVSEIAKQRARAAYPQVKTV